VNQIEYQVEVLFSGNCFDFFTHITCNKATKALIVSGWGVGIVWECVMRGAGKNIEEVTQSPYSWIHSNAPYIEVQE
jgi:hypothetical protein